MARYRIGDSDDTALALALCTCTTLQPAVTQQVVRAAQGVVCIFTKIPEPRGPMSREGRQRRFPLTRVLVIFQTTMHASSYRITY